MSQRAKTTRIILVNGPPFLHELVRKAINKNQAMKIVAEVHKINNYPSVAAQVKADWTYLMLPPEDEIPEAIEKVIKENTSMRILVMATDGSKVRVKWMEPHDHDIEVDNMEDIFNVLQNEELTARNFDDKID